jgi:hypothetical protein
MPYTPLVDFSNLDFLIIFMALNSEALLIFYPNITCEWHPLPRGLINLYLFQILF